MSLMSTFSRRLQSAEGATLAAAALLLAGAAYVLAPPSGPATAQERGKSVQAAPAAPAPAPQKAFNPEQKAAIEQIVKEYFLNNPEAFLDIQNALEAKMEKIQADKLKAALKDNARDIFRSADSPIVGTAGGDITVVEFFDYNCGYCKRAFGDIAKLVQKDQKVKFVFKELPILSKGSEDAARVALAAKAQGKYWEAHRALLAVRGEINEQTALKAVEKIGLDLVKHKKDMDSAEVKAEISFVRDLAQKMGIQGTPHFLVGERSIGGAPDGLSELLIQTAAEVRKAGGCKVC